MKKRIGTLKGKPIVEGGGSNIIKENEININDIGSSNNNDNDISYFGLGLTPELNKIISPLFPFIKIVDFKDSPVNVEFPVITGYPDNGFFMECGGNISNKSLYTNENWISIKDCLLETIGFNIEWLKPISKEDFYRTNYTREEAAKIKEEYYNHYLQNAPSKTE